MIFGNGQNHQNWTFKRPYLPKKALFENYLYAKINTIMLLYLYQIFIFLRGQPNFFLHFFIAFMENLFKKHPIQKKNNKEIRKMNILSLNLRYDRKNTRVSLLFWVCCTTHFI